MSSAVGAPLNNAAGSSSNNSKAPAAKKTVSTVTPSRGTSALDRLMTVDKNVVDELLLVCGVIGTTMNAPSNNDSSNNDNKKSKKNTDTPALVPVTDCLNWLQDLQRALRRDDDLYRPISLMLGKWNVVSHKLLPLVLTCRYDTPMVLTIVKILVILTKPLHENTKRAGRLVIDPNNKKLTGSVIEEQKKLRQNALAQSDMLMEYKRIITHHPSHRQTNKDGEGGLLSIFVSLLAEPLSKTGTKRTDADHLTIELVLHLLRNILSAEPIVRGSQETSVRSAQLHNECISLFERELVLEILLVLCQDMEMRENAQYNLLIMELLHNLLKSQDPTVVARCMAVEKHQVEAQSYAGKENPVAVSTTAEAKKRAKGNVVTYKAGGGGVLRAQMARDRQLFKSGGPARHGNFGGTLMVKREGGKRQYLSASKVMDKPPAGSAIVANTGGAKKRKNRKTEPFIGSGRTLVSHTRVGQTGGAHVGPSALRAQRTLHRFCQRFVDKCYGPVMKSLKNEFRRDSVRLEGDEDKVVLFRIIWFFFQWFRVSGFGKLTKAPSSDSTEDSGNKCTLGQLIFTMDVFTFNLVLSATGTFIEHKQWTRLAQAVALYTEMMHQLNNMYHSKDDTEQIMALGLMDRLFYGSEPVDRLPKLLTSWIPGTTSREYVCDLAELCHVTMKLLESNKKACAVIMEGHQGLLKGKKKVQTNDTVLQMKIEAADFDVTAYFVRKIVSNQVVFMYTKLLEQYALNAPHVNHRIVAFFLRLTKLKIAVAEDEDQPQPPSLGDADADGAPPKNLLASKTVTLEPMLYNINLIMVLEKILNDASIRNDKAFTTVLNFAAGIIHNFATAAKTSNPMLFVEMLFKSPVPHRHCDLVTNLYVDEELRMIAERELLLEEQRRYEHLAAAEDQSDDDNNATDDDEEEENEFNDDGIIGDDVQLLRKKRKRVMHRRKDKPETSNSDSDNSDEDENVKKTPEVESVKGDSDEPKRRKVLEDVDSDDKELELGTDKPSEPSSSFKKSKLSKVAGSKTAEVDDSSDEELDTAPPTSHSQTTNNAFDDSSDDESMADAGGTKTASKATASNSNEKADKTKLKRRVLEDLSSDEEQGGGDDIDDDDDDQGAAKPGAEDATSIGGLEEGDKDESSEDEKED